MNLQVKLLALRAEAPAGLASQREAFYLANEIAWRARGQPHTWPHMRPITGTGILLLLLLASVLSLGGFAGWYILSVRQYRAVQSELALAEQNRSRLRLLVADCLEYRKRNPAIDPLLQSVNILRLDTNAPARAK